MSVLNPAVVMLKNVSWLFIPMVCSRKQQKLVTYFVRNCTERNNIKLGACLFLQATSYSLLHTEIPSPCLSTLFPSK